MVDKLNQKIFADLMFTTDNETIETLNGFKDGISVIKSDWQNNTYAIGAILFTKIFGSSPKLEDCRISSRYLFTNMIYLNESYISQEISYSERKSEKIEEFVTIEMMNTVSLSKNVGNTN